MKNIFILSLLLILVVGCKTSTNPTDKLQAFDCTDPRPTACTKEYVPVCAQVNIQCITTPCNPIMETYPNKCTACANPLTLSYTNGECKNDPAGGTVPSGSPSEQCINVGGSWTGFDCEGLDLNQCQEIGGNFNECASACRNNPSAEVCTLQCVQVCELK